MAFLGYARAGGVSIPVFDNVPNSSYLDTFEHIYTKEDLPNIDSSSFGNVIQEDSSKTATKYDGTYSVSSIPTFEVTEGPAPLAPFIDTFNGNFVARTFSKTALYKSGPESDDTWSIYIGNYGSSDMRLYVRGSGSSQALIVVGGPESDNLETYTSYALKLYESTTAKASYMEWIYPESEITVNRGDVINNVFRLYPYPIGSDPIEPFTDVSIGFTSITDNTDTPQESLGPLFLDIQGTSVTIGERMYLEKFKLVAVANGYVYGPTENPLYPEGDPVKIIKVVTVTDPWDRTYGEGGESSGGGGNGSHSGPGGTISGGGVPSYSTRGDLPTGSAEADSSNTGLFTRYALGSAGLRGIAAALYADTILQNIGKEVMSFLWNSPSDGLISLVSYPFSVTSLPNVNSSSVSKMKFGSLELSISSTRLGSTFSQIEWGTITLDEYWGNFLDYAPHTKIDLYLPWCTGSVSLDPHECLPGSIEVVTNVELAKGTCCHSIFGNKGALIGTYYGTCGSVLPLTAIDTSGKALALVTAAAGVMSAVGNAGAATTAGIAAANSPETSARAYGLELSRGLDPMSARVLAQREAIQAAEAPYRAAQNRGIKVAAPSAIAAFRTPANVVRNGSFVANGPGMAMQFPFIILSRPEQNIPTNYAGHYGYPSNVLASLGSVSGYTEVAAIHLDGISGATMNEIEEIDALLKGGVIL